jgi:hypothetical protein
VWLIWVLVVAEVGIIVLSHGNLRSGCTYSSVAKSVVNSCYLEDSNRPVGDNYSYI